MKAPPPLPAAILDRVIRVARIDGWSIVVVAGAIALISAVQRDVTDALVGFVVTSAGVCELYGARLLVRRIVGGSRWLIGSQLYLLAAILGYCAFRLTHVDIAPLRAMFDRLLKEPAFREAWQANEDMGMSKDFFLGFLYRTLYYLVPVVTLIYQGGLAIYYQRRRSGIAAALATPAA